MKKNRIFSTYIRLHYLSSGIEHLPHNQMFLQVKSHHFLLLIIK